jgi:hypothetical protein
MKSLSLKYRILTMSTTEIKTELQQMIERENDVSILEAIRTILQKTSLNPILKEKLTERALKSETDIAEGRLLSKEEIQQRTQRR